MQTTRLIPWLAAAVFLCGVSTADAPEQEKVLRARVLAATYGPMAGKAYREYFEHVGRARLQEHLKDRDTGIALQAAWEVHKHPVVRAKPIEYRTDHIYDRMELEKFVTFLKERTRAPVPRWWPRAIVDVDVFPGKHHAFSFEHSDPPKMREAWLGTYVPEGAKLAAAGDRLVYTASGRTIRFKPEFGVEALDGVSALIGEKRSLLALHSTGGGFSFPLSDLETRGRRPLWKTEVWAAGRDILAGAGFHAVELREANGLVYVFGGESHGMYLEALDAATGRCRYRFCSCYWFNHSEAWDLK
jgi:hypothetical protein